MDRLDQIDIFDGADTLIRLLDLDLPSLDDLEESARAYKTLYVSVHSELLALDRLPGTETARADLETARQEAMAIVARPPGSGPKDRERAFENALERLKKGLQASKKAKKAAIKLQKRQQKAQKKERATERKQAGALLDYQSRRLLVVERQDEFAVRWKADIFEDVQKVVEAVNALLTSADSSAESKDFKAGKATLKQAIKTIKKGRKDHVARFEAALRGNPEILEALTGTMKKLSASETIPDEERDPLRVGVLTAIQPLQDGKATSSQALESVRIELMAAIALVVHALKKWDARAKHTGEALDEAHTLLSALTDLIPVSELLEEQAAIRSLEAYSGARRYDAFDEVFEELKTAGDARKRQVESDREAWSTAAAGLGELGTRCETHGADQQRCSFPHNPLELRASLFGLRDSVKARLVGYTAGVEEFTTLEEEVQANTERHNAWGALARPRSMALARMQERIEEVEAAIDELRTRTGEATGHEPEDGGQFSRKLADIDAEWQKRVRTAQDVGEFDTRLTETQLDTLTKEIEAIGDDELVSVANTDQVTKARAAYDAAREGLSELFATARLLGSETVGAMETTGAGIGRRHAEAISSEPVDPAPIVMLCSELEQLHADLEREIARLNRLVEGLKTTAQLLIDKIDKTLAAIVKVASGRHWWQSKKSQYRTYVETLHAQVDSVRGMIGIDNPQVLDKTVKRAEKIDKQASEALKGVRGVKDGRHPLLEKLSADIARYTKLVKGTKMLKTWRPGVHKQLLLELKNLADEVAKVPVDDLRERLDEVEVQASEALTQCQNDKEHSDDVVEDADQVLKRLKSFKGAFSAHGELYKSLYADVKGVKTTARQPRQQDFAETRLNGLAARLGKLVADGGQMQEASDDLARQKADAKQQKEEWKAKIEAFNRELIAKLKAPGIPRAKRKEVEKLRNDAKKSHSNGDPALAKQQLDAARQRGEFHLRFPEGEEKAAVSKLGKVLASFKKAVRTFLQELDTCEAYFNTLEADSPDDTAALRKALIKPIDALRTSFSETAFDTDLGVVRKLDAGVRNRAAARESAMERVRLYQDRLRNDRRLTALASHPFEGAETTLVRFKGHYDVGKALQEMDRNLRISVDMKKA